MDLLEYVKAIKRRWRLVAVVVVVALLGAGLSTLFVKTETRRKTYAAKTSLFQSSSPADGSARNGTTRPAGTRGQLASLSTIATLLKGSEMTERVAKLSGREATLQRVNRRLQTSVDPSAGLLTIIITASDPALAVKLAATYATEFLKFLNEHQAAANAEEATAVRKQIARVRSDIAALDRKIARYQPAPVPTTGPATRRQTTSPADPLITERTAALRQLGLLSDRYQEIQSREVNAQGLTIFEPAQLAPVGAGQSLSFPRPLGTRLLIALILGVLVGLAFALLRDRFDRRIRSKEAAESAFGFPVVAEIPPSRKRALPMSLPAQSRMAPQVVDAFRLLGAGLNGARHHGHNAFRHNGLAHPRVILVTSAGPSEGKTTVVANLATTLADAGKVVTVLACDFRHPDIHRVFGIPDGQGISNIATADAKEPILNDLTWCATSSGVWVVPAGTAATDTADLLSSPNIPRAFTEARQRSDFVLVDTSPILTSDVAYLLSEVDAVLVVAKAGRTKPELAERSGELLKRLEAPVEGIVLIGETPAMLPRRYYRKSLLRRLLGVPALAVHSIFRSERAGASIVKASRPRTRGIPRLSRRSTEE